MRIFAHFFVVPSQYKPRSPDIIESLLDETKWATDTPSPGLL